MHAAPPPGPTKLGQLHSSHQSSFDTQNELLNACRA